MLTLLGRFRSSTTSRLILTEYNHSRTPLNPLARANLPLPKRTVFKGLRTLPTSLDLPRITHTLATRPMRVTGTPTRISSSSTVAVNTHHLLPVGTRVFLGAASATESAVLLLGSISLSRHP